MKTVDCLRLITGELQGIFDHISEDQLQELVKKIHGAKRVFVAGAGRSRLMICGFAMRLMQSGFVSYVVGDVVTPSIQKEDLLIIASGSGSTGTLCVIAEGCKKIGAELALITTSPDSPIGQLADCIVEIPTTTSKHADESKKALQPGASAFEQSVLLVCDALTMSLLPGENTGEQNRLLMGNHANLE